MRRIEEKKTFQRPFRTVSERFRVQNGNEFAPAGGDGLRGVASAAGAAVQLRGGAVEVRRVAHEGIASARKRLEARSSKSL